MSPAIMGRQEHKLKCSIVAVREGLGVTYRATSCLSAGLASALTAPAFPKSASDTVRRVCAMQGAFSADALS